MSLTQFPPRNYAAGLLGGCLACLALTASAADRLAERALYQRSLDAVSGLKLEQPLALDNAVTPGTLSLDQSLIGAAGRQRVIVRLNTPPTASMSDDQRFLRRDRKHLIDYEQLEFLARCQTEYPSIRELGRTQHVLNAVFLDVPAAALEGIARDPMVERVAPVGHYQLNLDDTVPYIGAAAVQAAGFDGSGVSVAVLDSGVDYTHADLGGSGDPADYASNDGTIIEPGTFPNAKVVDGYDFLGNVWPTGPGGFDDPPLPDPDPLDDLALVPGSFAGHGTHVADIIGGARGVAPGADIVAVKVCSSLTPSCNGIALIMGMEFSVDPNGDGDPTDRVDIINLSLGADYGQPFDDDLSTAVDNASALGTTTVSSAGNCGDFPYCTGTPSSAPTAIAVAQTNVPSATAFAMNVVEPVALAGLYEAVKYPWTPDPADLISGPVQYGDTDGDNLLGCDPFDGDLTGMIVAVDRGACNFSLKMQNIEAAGGALGIVMLVAPGAPFPGSFGGGDPVTIPGFNISQDDGDILRAGDAVIAFGPEFSTPLVGITVSSTARGPDLSFNAIKPDIGAPGASVSALVGTGSGTEPFGGTSGASPMVAGAVALLQEQCRADDGGKKRKRRGGCSPLELKARLMNTAYRDVLSDTTGDLAEITRIGGGELQVNAAAAAKFIVWSPDDDQPSLSLGYEDVDAPVTIKRRIRIKNVSKRRQNFTFEPTFRFADDAATGAVSVEVNRRRVSVPPGGSRTVQVAFEIDPSLLSGNPLNSGSQGGNPAALTAAEYDGYLLVRNFRGDEAALPWHIIPRQAAKVDADRQRIKPRQTPDSIGLTNWGAGVAQNDAYTLVGLSDEMPRGERGAQMPTPDLRAVGVTTIPVPAGFCSDAESFIWAFAVNTWDRQSHLLPVSHQIDLDVDRDGTADFTVLNAPLSFFADGSLDDAREATGVLDPSGAASVFFFTEHATNTNNSVLLICAEQIGFSRADFLRPVDISVNAVDFYNGGPGDLIDGITVAPLGEQYFGAPSGDLPAGATGALEVLDLGAVPELSPNLGVMLFTNGDRGAGARGGATEDSEAKLFLLPGVERPKPLRKNRRR